MDGYLTSTDSWFNNPVSQVSSQYGIGLTGLIHQYTALHDTAYANGIREPGNWWPGPTNKPVNHLTVSIETEDYSEPTLNPVSPAQYDSVLYCSRLALNMYPNIAYVTSHHVISPRSRANCAGSRWNASGKLAQLAHELGLELVN